MEKHAVTMPTARPMVNQTYTCANVPGDMKEMDTIAKVRVKTLLMYNKFKFFTVFISSISQSLHTRTNMPRY